MSSTPAAPPVGWCLESTFDGGKHLERVPIEALPFRIGRVEGLELTIPSKSVSKHHAEIFVEDGMLRLRDLSSTNGTFVNRERVSGASLREGDIVHFAEFEFRLGRQPADGLRDGEDTFAERGTLALGHIELPAQFVKGTRELGELLEEQKAGAVFQPIVSLQSGEVAAYEILGRGRHDGLPESPAELFRIASTVGAGIALSRLFRQKAMELLPDRSDLPLLFLNTHPEELAQPGFIESLERVREAAPDAPLALEIHESTLADPKAIAELQVKLTDLDIGLAYDDFGTGQARLLELAEVPPDYLKFAMDFIRGIDQAPPSKRRLLSALVAVARDLEAQPIAEGIETEAEVCVAVGFTLAQGYYYGMPLAADHL